MHVTTRDSRRFGRSAGAVLAAAALAVIGGCSSSNTNSSAVDAPGTTHVKNDAGQFDAARAFPTGDKSNSMVMIEATGPKTVRVEQEAAYQIKVTNLTDVPLHNVIVSSSNPEGFRMTGVTGSTTQPSEGGHLAYAVGDLGPKTSKMINVTGVATKVGPVDTCYAVRYDYEPSTLCTSLAVTNPTLTLAVTSPADVDICQPLTYQYTVANSGVGTAHNVSLQENLPDGLTTADGKQAVMANLGDIPQGENRMVTAKLKASKTGSFPGQATAKSDGDVAPPVATATAVHAPALAVAVKGAESDFVGKQVAYTVVVTNKGDAPAANTKVKLSHGSGLGFVTATGIDASGAVAVGELAPNASKTINATVTCDQGGDVTVVAEASADCAQPVSDHAQTTFNTIPALLLETSDEVDPVKVGQIVVYDVKVTNQGSGPDANISVKATIPDGETYVSTAGPSQPAVDGMTLTFPVIAALAPKESVTWKISVKANKVGDVQFKTSASSDGVKAGAEKTEPTKLY